METWQGTILVVDDDHDVLEAIQDVLEREGYVVRAARDGVEAKAVLAHEDVDLVLLDLMMPRMSGWDFLDQVTGNEPPIIVLTAAPSDVEVGGSVRAVLKKPCGRGALLAAVKRHQREHP